MGSRSLAEANHCQSIYELSMRFALWAAEQRFIPTREEITARYDVSYCTAYRLRNAYCDATWQPIPRSLRYQPIREPQARRQPASTKERD